jgi:GT2 family glycosyltransferase
MRDVSIVTPAYNQAQFFGDCLESVSSQSVAPKEHVIVDAMSTDETPAIVDAYHPPYSVTKIRESDRGQSDGINKGVLRCSGEIVSWLNSDDYLLPGALAAVVEAFADFPDAVAICGIGWKVGADGARLKQGPYRPFSSMRLRTALEYVQPASFYRLAAWKSVGGLDESLHYAMDWDLLLKLSAIGRIVAIPSPLAAIRYYSETKTSTGGWRRAAEIAAIGRRHNGPWDLNNLSYQLRRVFANVKVARRLIDGVTWKISASQPIMIQGWPDQ